jgi:fatty-acyl-CoA synthase
MSGIVRRRVTSAEDVADLERLRPEDLRPGDTIHACLVAAAAEDPGKSAIILVEPPDFDTPARTLTYRELIADVERSASLFHYLAGPDSVVGVMLPMIPEGLTALWGAATAGVGLPLNPFLEQAALCRILSDTQATAFVTTTDILAERGGPEAFFARVPSLLRIFTVEDFRQAIDGYDGLAFEPDGNPDRTVMVMPTGGTTGAPKLVRMTHRGQLTVAWNVGALMGSERDGVVGHGMPNFHCGGTISLGLRAMIFGQTLLTLSTVGYRSREVVASFWDIARRYRMTSLLATPTTALALLHAGGDATGHCLADFHVGGSTVPVDLVRAFHDRFGIWLRENWGMTELHGTITGHFNDGTPPRVGSAGRALPHFTVRAVELDGSGRFVRDCAPGERGALLIGGPSVTSGYLSAGHDAEFFPAGLDDDVAWGNTGDLGAVDEDGYVWVFGRTKDVIIRGGHNLDPREIENALAAHPAVHLVAAVGRPDARKGELPMAYVQLKDGIHADPAELLEFCRQQVQEQAAVPVELVVLDELPLTPVGKISKPALRVDALVREVRSLVDVPSCEIRVDNSGPRPRVVVVLDEAAGVAALTCRLAAYEFASSVQTRQLEAP